MISSISLFRSTALRLTISAILNSGMNRMQILQGCQAISIAIFGCWGDPNDKTYYGGEYYAEMLKRAYPAVKAANPQAIVLNGGLLLDCDPRYPPPGKDCLPADFWRVYYTIKVQLISISWLSMVIRIMGNHMMVILGKVSVPKLSMKTTQVFKAAAANWLEKSTFCAM